MAEWIASLTGMEKFYALCAAIGGILFLIRTGLMLFGADNEMDMEIGGDGGAMDSDTSFHLISLQGLTAFFTMFGLVALALSKQSGAAEVWAVLGGVAAGLAAVWIIGRIFKGMKNLQSDGTVRVANAVGQEGTVYLTVPAEGSGQVQVTVQGRLRIYDAVSVPKTAIKTGSRIRVLRVTGSNTLEVEPV